MFWNVTVKLEMVSNVKLDFNDGMRENRASESELRLPDHRQNSSEGTNSRPTHTVVLRPIKKPGQGNQSPA